MSIRIGFKSLWPVVALGFSAVCTLSFFVCAVVDARDSDELKAMALDFELQNMAHSKLISAVASVAQAPSPATSSQVSKLAQVAPSAPKVAFAAPKAMPIKAAVPPALTVIKPTITPVAIKNDLGKPTADLQNAAVKLIPVHSNAQLASAVSSSRNILAPAPDKTLQKLPVASDITHDMIAAAKKTNKIEGVDGGKLGVSKVNDNHVSLSNGGKINIGDRFPSGERLLSLDPENGQIVTDKRTLLVF